MNSKIDSGKIIFKINLKLTIKFVIKKQKLLKL